MRFFLTLSHYPVSLDFIELKIKYLHRMTKVLSMDFIVRSHYEKTALRSYTKVHCKLCLQCNSGFDNETFGPLGQLKSPYGTF